MALNKNQGGAPPAAPVGPRLIGLNDEVSGREFLLAERTLIGRNEQAEIFLPDLSVSRKHCEIERTGAGFLLRDMGSRSGTRLNGVLVQESPLRDQDQLAVGKFILRFDAGQTSSVARKIQEGSTVTVDEAIRLKEIALVDFSFARRFADATEKEQINRLRQHLESVQQVAEAIQTTLDVQELLNLTLTELFNVFPKVDRGFIFLHDAETNELIPKAIKTRHKDSMAVGFSNTVLNYVEAERKAVLSMDAAQDERFNKALSVQFNSMRTHMCVPLVVRGDCVGAIYMVAGGMEGSRSFDEDDLALLSSVAGTVAVSVKNAALSAAAQRAAQLNSNLQRYVSADVTRRLIDSGIEGALGPHLSDGIAMFSDLVGFTTLSEQMSPDRVAKLLNRYFNRTLQIVFEHGGSINKFGGDSFLAVWGAIDPAPKDMQPVVAAALEIHAATFRLSAELQAEGLTPVQLTVGLNQGRFFAGDIGSEERMEFTIIGDSVNIAARVQALAHGGQVLAPWHCFEETAAKLGAILYPNEFIRGREGHVTVASLRSLRIETGGAISRWLISLPVQMGDSRQNGLMISAVSDGKAIEFEVLSGLAVPPGTTYLLQPELAEWPDPLPAFEAICLRTSEDELLHRLVFRANVRDMPFADLITGDGRCLTASKPLRRKS